MLLKQKRQEFAECWQFSEKVKFKAQDIGYTVVGIKTKIETSISDESRLMSVYDMFFSSPWLLCGTFFKLILLIFLFNSIIHRSFLLFFVYELKMSQMSNDLIPLQGDDISVKLNCLENKTFT